MDRIAEQVEQVEASVARLRIDVDNILSAIQPVSGEPVSPPHAEYWRRLVEVLTNLVLDADDRFNGPDPKPPE